MPRSEAAARAKISLHVTDFRLDPAGRTIVVDDFDDAVQREAFIEGCRITIEGQGSGRLERRGADILRIHPTETTP